MSNFLSCSVVLNSTLLHKNTDWCTELCRGGLYNSLLRQKVIGLAEGRFAAQVFEMHEVATAVIFHIYFHPFFFRNPLSAHSWLSDNSGVWSPGLQQLSFFLPTVVYVTEARAVKVWRPDRRRGGTNGWDRCQSNTQAFQRCKQTCACTTGHNRGFFLRLLHIKCNLLFSWKCIKSSSLFENRFGVPNFLLWYRWAKVAQSCLLYNHMEVLFLTKHYQNEMVFFSVFSVSPRK